MNERWLPIPGYEGWYEVSDKGRVRSLDRRIPHPKGGTSFIRGRVMSTPLDRRGYPRLLLKKAGEYQSWAVHRAVMAAFMPRPDWREMHVNHKDGVTHNNSLENLEWCTVSENRLHSYRVLKRPNPSLGRTGVQHHNSKPIVGVCIATGERREYAACTDAAADGFDPRLIGDCARGHQKSHRGWTWARPENGTAGARKWSLVQ